MQNSHNQTVSALRVGILGSAGYTGGELLRLLIHHPFVYIAFAHSHSQAGKKWYEVHTDLLGDTEGVFSAEVHEDVDAVFLCVGHGDAQKALEKFPFPASVKIIDLSQDFRHYNSEHCVHIADAGTVQRQFVYGLPELQRERIAIAQHIANPGCFATAIQLALLPLAAGHHLNDAVNISATTGSTGAGQSLSETAHFTWRHANLSVYKALEHQHLKEIRQSLVQLQPNFNHPLPFIPQRGAFTRGILAALHTKFEGTQADAQHLYHDFYADHPFTHVSNTAIDLKQVVNTNKCLLYTEVHEATLLVVSVIDNLLKGASGQAVQNLNLLFGLDEKAGLCLKGG